MPSSYLDVSGMFVERQAQRSSMHARHLNEQLVRVLKTIGYDVGFQKGQGQYLFDRDGARYLDLLSGFGVFAIGRNHPALREALKSVLDSDFPNLVQLDVSTLAGVLAERLLEHVPYLDKVFFANSGAETVEAAIKFARGATLCVEHRGPFFQKLGVSAISECGAASSMPSHGDDSVDPSPRRNSISLIDLIGAAVAAVRFL